MVNQVIVICTVAVLAEACALAERAGVSAALIPAALAGGRADSYALREFMPKMAESNFSPTGSISIMLKDLEVIHRLSESVKAKTPLSSLITQIHRELVARGLGGHDCSEIVNFYRHDGDYPDTPSRGPEAIT